MSRKPSILLFVVAGGLLVATAATAQQGTITEFSANLAAASPTMSPEGRQAMMERIEEVNSTFRTAHGGQGPEQFGVQCCQITQIPVPAFTFSGSSDPWSYSGVGYYYAAPGSGPISAAVQLPSGTEIKFLDLYYYDEEPVTGIAATLRAYSGGGLFSGPPDETVLATVVSSGNPGYGYAASTMLNYTVNNNVGFDPAAAQLHVRVGAGPGSTLRFKAVDLWWMRKVSPAPATATFTDVPTNHQFFQFVEALVAAGITAGYGDGRYGVGDPITRGQMAVFLAKALGLHWAY